jgi:hypothetical protein
LAPYYSFSFHCFDPIPSSFASGCRTSRTFRHFFILSSTLSPLFIFVKIFWPDQ